MTKERSNARGFTRRFLTFFYRLLDGDDVWAEWRAALVITAVMIFAFMGRATEQIVPWEPLQPYLAGMPPIVAAIFNFIASLFYAQSLRHLLPPLAAFVLAVLLASNYVRDLFELPDLGTGRRYLMASMFGLDYPKINIKGGGYEVSEKSEPGLGQAHKAETNPIPKIGGPGFVGIAPGNVALFERYGKPSRVAGAGKHFISRFETLRGVFDLRDQFRTKDEVKAVTKDGIPVTVRNVQVSFRIRTGSRRSERKREETYPFSAAAIRRITYSRTAGPKGPSAWTDGAVGAVVGMVRGYISRNRLDDLISRGDPEDDSEQNADAPKGPPLPANKPADPRDRIKDEINSQSSYIRFAEMGIEFLWVSLGHIETPQDILDKRIGAWQAKWQREERVTIERGKADGLRLMELARGRARKEFIEKILRNLPTGDALTDEVIIIQFVEGLNSILRPAAPRSTSIVVDPVKMLSFLNLYQQIQNALSAPGDESEGPIIEN